MERGQTGIVGVVKIVVDLFTGGEQQHGVARGGVGVNGDAVEAPSDAGVEAGLQELRLDGKVGEDKGQHRRHVGRDHAAALCDTDDMAGGTVDSPGGTLTEGVGRADRTGRSLPALGATRVEFPDERWQFGAKERVRHRLADHPGRRHKHLVGEDAEAPGDRLCGEPHAGFTGGTGERIGVPCVAHDRPSRPVALSEDLLAPIDWGRRTQARCEDTGHRGAFGEFRDEEVITPGVAQ